jgi:hypothetical protein
MYVSGLTLLACGVLLVTSRPWKRSEPSDRD